MDDNAANNSNGGKKNEYDDKAIYKMIASQLERAIAIADNELPHTGDLESLVTNLKKLSNQKENKP